MLAASRRPAAALVLLSAGALAGCETLVDRYDSTSPTFVAEYVTQAELIRVTGQAEEYCGVFNRRAERTRIEVVDGEPFAVFDCL